MGIGFKGKSGKIIDEILRSANTFVTYRSIFILEEDVQNEVLQTVSARQAIKQSQGPC